MKEDAPTDTRRRLTWLGVSVLCAAAMIWAAFVLPPDILLHDLPVVREFRLVPRQPLFFGAVLALILGVRRFLTVKIPDE